MGGSGSSGSTGRKGGIFQGGDCPRKFETTLTDVIPTGNVDYTSQLNSGDALTINISQDENALVISHSDTVIGYLPPHYLNIIECIKNGWNYSISIIAISGDTKNPKIRVLVIGAP